MDDKALTQRNDGKKFNKNVPNTHITLFVVYTTALNKVSWLFLLEHTFSMRGDTQM